jgi:predicted TIM-barrel fold metal-dependent hydrolase
MKAALDIRSYRAIDIHGHVGRYHGSALDLIDGFYSGVPEDVLRRATWANVEYTFVSHLGAIFIHFGGDPVASNRDLAAEIGRFPGLFHWVVVEPGRPETFAQAEALLKTPRCVGIKIHPELHKYPIKEQGRKIFEFAARQGAVVLSHSGEDLSSPAEFVPFANDFPGVKLILAHIGWSRDGNMTRQVKAVQMSRHGNIFADTSSSMSITSNLIEWAVAEIGPERILFGTDTPLYFSPMQRARIDNAEISSEAKKMILRGNAERLFSAKLGTRFKA